METRHRVHAADARDLDGLAEDSVELVVTSPPYPMIEMWDDLFADLDPAIEAALAAGDGRAAFDAMHDALAPVWAELRRVLVPGGIACVNVGDATRTLGGSFRVYENHARITEAFDDLGFDPLPEVLWRKPTNAASKFMGSGMLPPNAYVTLEHEYVLVFRNGPDRRSFEPRADRRYEAAYFWEERNHWFSDLWTDVGGERQTLPGDARERSAAYPFAIPYRLINMYSAYGDTVLDPFLGTGTTTLAAMVAGRHSAGYEIDPDLVSAVDERVDEAPALSREVAGDRLDAHRAFVAQQREAGETFGYTAEHYDVPVTTTQERRIRLYAVDRVDRVGGDPTEYRAVHDPVEEVGRGESR